MKAAVFRCYGPPDVIEIEDVPDPVPGEDQALVRVAAASVNAVDWHRVRGEPFLVRLTDGLRRPNDPRVGADIAGVVEATGSRVTTLAPGDEVFGMTMGAFAELAAVKAEGLVRKPPGVSFEVAGAIAVAGLTALQGLRLHGRVGRGQHVLVNGAGGGVGHLAVQIAKALGARVTAWTSVDKIEFVRSLGADDVQDYAGGAGRNAEPPAFDVVFDAGGWLSLRENRRLLRRGGVALLAGAGSRPSLLRLGARVAGARILTRLDGGRYVSYVAHRTPEDLETLRSMLEEGRIRAAIDRQYPLAELAEAIRYHETGQSRGKVVVTMGEASASPPTAA